MVCVACRMTCARFPLEYRLMRCLPWDDLLGEKETMWRRRKRWRGNGMFSIPERLSLAHTPNANIIEKYIRFHLSLFLALSSPFLHIRANLPLAGLDSDFVYDISCLSNSLFTSLFVWCKHSLHLSAWLTCSLFPSQLDYGWMFFYVDIRASESNRLEGTGGPFSSPSPRLITWVITVFLTLSQRDLLTISSVCCVCFSRRLCFHLCPFSPLAFPFIFPSLFAFEMGSAAMILSPLLSHLSFSWKRRRGRENNDQMWFPFLLSLLSRLFFPFLCVSRLFSLLVHFGLQQ